MQEFIFNINVPTRVGFQTPFTNLTMDIVIPDSYKNEAAIVGGKPTDKKYGDFQHEADLINKAFCDVMIEGDAKGRIFSFPIPTYNVTKDFDWNNPDLEGLWEMTAKYGTPYLAVISQIGSSPSFFQSKSFVMLYVGIGKVNGLPFASPPCIISANA